MAKPYDASLRVLIEQYLPDWMAIAPRKAIGPVRVIDSDLSTVTAEADKLLYVDDPQPWILHLEPQASWDGNLEKRLSWYNGIVSYKYDCLVHSAVVLLRREADSPRLTGEFVQTFPGETPYRVFRYQVIRVWQLAANDLANGSWGMFPLALLCDDAKPQLPTLIERMASRLRNEISQPQEISTLWKITALLADMRYDQEVILPLMRKAMTMMVKLEDFPSYSKGVVKGIRETVVRQGTRRFGPPDAATLAVLEATKSLERLGYLSERLLEVNSWQELLADEAPPTSTMNEVPTDA
jgi:hypothetical protein